MHFKIKFLKEPRTISLYYILHNVRSIWKVKFQTIVSIQNCVWWSHVIYDAVIIIFLSQHFNWQPRDEFTTTYLISVKKWSRFIFFILLSQYNYTEFGDYFFQKQYLYAVISSSLRKTQMQYILNLYLDFNVYCN